MMFLLVIVMGNSLLHCSMDNFSKVNDTRIQGVSSYNNNNLYLLPLAIRITVILQEKFKTVHIYTYQIKLSLAPLGINDCLCLTVRDTGILRCTGLVLQDLRLWP